MSIGGKRVAELSPERLERRREVEREYSARNREKRLAYGAKYRAENREKLRVSQRKAQKRYYEKYPGRAKETKNRWRARNPNSGRALMLKKQYGLTLEAWDALFAGQGHCCASCLTVPPPGRKVPWHTDHCHKTGLVRGILCSDCNKGLGCFKDDPTRLELAAKYLRKSNSI